MRNFASETTSGLFAKTLTAPSGYVPPVLPSARVEKALEPLDAELSPAEETALLAEFQQVLERAIVFGDRVECDTCPELTTILRACTTELEKAQDSAAIRRCVSAKIPLLIREGKEQKQAVAIAFSMCRKNARAHLKKASEKAAYDMTVPGHLGGPEGFDSRPPGEYAQPEAEQAPPAPKPPPWKQPHQAPPAAKPAMPAAPVGKVNIVPMGGIRTAAAALVAAIVGDVMSKIDPSAASARAQQAWETRRRAGERAVPGAPSGAAPAEAPGAEMPEMPAEAPMAPPAAAAPPAMPAAPEEQPEAAPAGAPAGAPTTPHVRATVDQASTRKVQSIMARHGLTNQSEDVEEMAGFKTTLGQRGKGRTIDQLKRDFLTNMNPQNYPTPQAFQQAKVRMQRMPAEDFGKILAAIHEEEEGAAMPGMVPAGAAA